MGDEKNIEYIERIYDYLSKHRDEISIVRLQMSLNIELSKLNEILKFMSKNNILKNNSDFERIILDI